MTSQLREWMAYRDGYAVRARCDLDRLFGGLAIWGIGAVGVLLAYAFGDGFTAFWWWFLSVAVVGGIGYVAVPEVVVGVNDSGMRVRDATVPWSSIGQVVLLYDPSVGSRRAQVGLRLRTHHYRTVSTVSSVTRATLTPSRRRCAATCRPDGSTRSGCMRRTGAGRRNTSCSSSGSERQSACSGSIDLDRSSGRGATGVR